MFCPEEAAVAQRLPRSAAFSVALELHRPRRHLYPSTSLLTLQQVEEKRNTLSTAVLPLGKESSSVLQHSPWGHGAGPATGSPVSPVWKEGPRLVTALMLINVPASKQPSPPGHC